MMIPANLKQYVESIVWVFALTLLFLLDPGSAGYSFCIFKLIGFDACWGCGLGHSIHYALHLDFEKSVSEHLLGIPVLLVLSSVIIKPLLPRKKIELHEPAIYDDPRPSA